MSTKVKSAKSIGKKQCYNLRMRSSSHNYVTGGIVNKNSHAISYGVLSYQTAYLKAHYPAEYMAALLTSVANKKERLYPYLDECKRIGLEVRPPSVKLSEEDFTVKDDNLIFGLAAIDGVGDKLTVKIIEDRKKYGESHNFFEFMRNSSPGVLDKRSIEKLLAAGALDDVVESEAEPGEQDVLRMLSDEQKQIGIFVSGHPLEAKWGSIKGSISHTISQLEEVSDGNVVYVAGVVTAFNKRTTKSGNPLYRIKIEDLTGIFDVIIFGRTINKDNLKPEDFIVGSSIKLTARVKRDEFMDQEEVSLIYIAHEVLQDAVEDNLHVIDVTGMLKSGWIFDKIDDIIKNTKGDIPIVLNVNNDSQVLSFRLKERTTKQGIKEIEELLVGH